MAIKTYTSTKTDQQRLFVHLLTGVLVHVAKADGKIDQREIRIIRLFFQDHLGYKGDQLLWIKDLIKEWLKSSRSIESICEEVNVHFSFDAKLLLLQMAYQVASADGAITGDEKYLINKIVTLLGISEAFNRSMGANIAQDSKEKYYAVLGLQEEASEDEIKKAYRDLVRQYHPDKVRNLGEEFRHEAENKIREINAAYEVLSKEVRASK